MTINRILFITLSNIGDVVMTTPVLQAIHQQYPHAVIDVMGDARSEILLKHCPFLGQFIHKEKNVSFRKAWELIKQIRKSQYDLAVDLRTDGLLYVLGAKHNYHKVANQKTLAMHSVEKHFEAIRPLVDMAIPHTKTYLSEFEMANADRFFAEHRITRERVLALGLGANFAGKVWPVTEFLTLANGLQDMFEAVLLVGSDKETRLADRFIAQYQGDVLNACGEFDLLQTTALIAKADYFVGNDSGLGHLASSVGVPTCTVFGVGEPNRYRPWGEKAVWLQAPDLEIKHVTSEEVIALIKRSFLSPSLKQSIG